MNVGHATVTQLQGISVKYFMERIVFREAIINCLEELYIYIYNSKLIEIKMPSGIC
jgi:hypothetical protein